MLAIDFILPLQCTVLLISVFLVAVPPGLIHSLRFPLLKSQDVLRALPGRVIVHLVRPGILCNYMVHPAHYDVPGRGASHCTCMSVAD